MVKIGKKLDQEENTETGLLDATKPTLRVVALENNF